MKTTAESSTARSWLIVFSVLLSVVSVALLCVLAVNSIWNDVNRFIGAMSGLRLNWVAVILGATGALLVNYIAQLWKTARAFRAKAPTRPALFQRIAALPVLLVWSAMVFALFMEAGDAVLVSQAEYLSLLLGPWLLVSIAAGLSFYLWRRHRRGEAGPGVFAAVAVSSLACVILAVALFLQGRAAESDSAPMTRPPQRFHDQVIFDGTRDPDYITFRIPGIVVTPAGVVLAYCEARESYSDWGKIDICMKRSRDGGDTWEERVTLYAGRDGTVNNPVMIAERGSETVHLLYNTNYNRAFYRKSLNAGATWSKTVELTPVFEAFRATYPWKVIAFGPGHGIQLSNRRLIAPVWLSPGGGSDGHHPQHSSTLYSDDGGATWHAGQMVSSLGEPGMGEPVAVELSDGSVMLNMRNEIFDSDRVYRAVSTSRDGARGWSRPVQNRGLPDAVCFGSLHRYDAHTILFSNVHSDLRVDWKLTFFKLRGAREPLGIRASFDDGKTWPVARIYRHREGGYSDIFVNRGVIHALYEQGWQKRNKYRTDCLRLARFNLAWVKEGR
ncbi:MAG TPA: sialidase family protein [Spirochaetota bacterium]|nr:sialidase family protein [Spirochaetota bacterium]